MARRDRTDMRPASAISVLLAVLIGILGALLWVHWLACSQASGAALCLTATSLPVRGTRWRRTVRRLQIWWAEQRLASTEHQLAQWNQMLLEDRLKREDLRDDVARQQRRLLNLRSRP